MAELQRWQNKWQCNMKLGALVICTTVLFCNTEKLQCWSQTVKETPKHYTISCQISLLLLSKESLTSDYFGNDLSCCRADRAVSAACHLAWVSWSLQNNALYRSSTAVTCIRIASSRALLWPSCTCPIQTLKTQDVNVIYDDSCSMYLQLQNNPSKNNNATRTQNRNTEVCFWYPRVGRRANAAPCIAITIHNISVVTLTVPSPM